jgi:hypothetical protein
MHLSRGTNVFFKRVWGETYAYVLLASNYSHNTFAQYGKRVGRKTGMIVLMCDHVSASCSVELPNAETCYCVMIREHRDWPTFGLTGRGIEQSPA